MSNQNKNVSQNPIYTARNLLDSTFRAEIAKNIIKILTLII